MARDLPRGDEPQLERLPRPLEDRSRDDRIPNRTVCGQFGRGGVPLELSRLNPKVLERRRLRIQRALEDSAGAAEKRRRYVETIVDNHIWKGLTDDRV